MLYPPSSFKKILNQQKYGKSRENLESTKVDVGIRNILNMARCGK